MADDDTPKRPVRCPICGREQTGLSIRTGLLWSDGTQVLGYVCQGCGRPIHWGVRGANKRRKTRKPPPGR